MKTIEDFKRQAKAKNITRWNIHDCSMCGYHCGYNIKNEEVSYDSGCNCVSYWDNHPSNWQEMANHYNRNLEYANDPKNKKPELTKAYVEEMNQFWGFT